MSQLNMFDYINGITIGSIAAELATNLDKNVLLPVISIIVYTTAISLISFISSRNMKARRFFTGKSIVLMDKGKLFYDNFKTAKIDLNEFLSLCRINGFFNIDDIETAMLEQNGMLSFLPRSVSRPVSPKDLTLMPEIDRPFFSLISDGEILCENMKQSGLTEKALDLELKSQRLEISDVFAAFYDGKKLSVYPRLTDNSANDISQ